MKVKRIIAAVSAAAVLAGITGTLCYEAGKDATASQLESMQDEIDSLRAGQEDATIVRRVSKQMEDIAYNQKSISDEQRDRAEKQSVLAMQMRDRAEKESQAARQAEGKAVASAQEAQQQRELAQQQQKEAESQRDQARKAKLKSDTLTYRTVGKNMAKFTNIQDQEVARQLSYGSWLFLKRYKGETYNPDTFKGLEQQSGEFMTDRLNARSAINAITPLPSNKGCIAVTNYGDVVRWEGSKLHYVLKDSKYDFRGVWADNSSAYAVSLNGPLVKVNLSSGTQKAILLPADKYIDLLHFGNKLLAVGKTSITWVDPTSEKIERIVTLPQALSTACVGKNEVNLFYENTKQGKMDTKGNLQEATSYIKKNFSFISSLITAATYDEHMGLVVGTKDGIIFILTPDGGLGEAWGAHKFPIIQLAVVGDVLVSTAYDRKMCIYKLVPKENPVKNGPQLEQESTFPVDYQYTSWPLALTSSSSQNRIWMGTGDGELVSLNVNEDDMAAKLKTKLNAGIGQLLWEYFVSKDIPYEDFTN